jgi:hypothetical protein
MAKDSCDKTCARYKHSVSERKGKRKKIREEII